MGLYGWSLRLVFAFGLYAGLELTRLTHSHDAGGRLIRRVVFAPVYAWLTILAEFGDRRSLAFRRVMIDCGGMSPAW